MSRHISGHDRFDDIMSAVDTAMWIVTARAADDGERAGCLMGFAAQVSIDPLRFLACISKANHTYGVAERSTHLAVHLLDRGALDAAALFGGQTGDEIDKFERCAWHEGPHGLPILDECPCWFVGAVRERVDLGDHVGHVLDIAEVGDGDLPGTVVRLHDVEHLSPGHAAEDF